MKPRIMYIESKAGGLAGGDARIGRVTFSKTGQTIYYSGRTFHKIPGGGFKSNYYDEANKDEYWFSGPRKDGRDRLYGERVAVKVDEDVRDEYWTLIRELPNEKEKKTVLTPILIGYFPKCTVQRPDWLKVAGIDEICSVSTCISEAPKGWIDQWKHNEMWVYDTPELAWSVVPDAARAEFHVYSYRLFPVQFDEGQQKPFEIPAINAAPLPASFERLGLDIVSRSCRTSYECSPLSCNHRAEHVAANRYCLVDDVDVAFRLAAEFEASGYEPGPYHVVEVWRKRRDGS